MRECRPNSLFSAKALWTAVSLVSLLLQLILAPSLLAQEEEADFAAPTPKENSNQQKIELPLPVTGHFDSATVEIDRVVTAYMTERAVPGAAVAITRGGKLVYAKGFGYSDLENKEAVQPDSLFRIAGVSKAITQATILQLVQRGHLGLNDKVFELLKIKPLTEAGKEMDPRIYDITIGDLLDHRSGWDTKLANRNLMFHQEAIATAFGVKPPPNSEQMISYAMGQALGHDPGTTFSYSNLDYILLGHVVEEVTRQPYAKYAHENILRSIGILDMRLGNSQLNGRAGNEVKYYAADGEKSPSIMASERGKLVPVQYGGWCLETMDASDGWIASAIDLARFASAFEYSEEFAALKGELMRSRFHPGYSQIGCLPGSSSIMIISRKFPDTCWAILFNSNSARPSEINERLVKAMEAVTTWPEYDLFERYLESAR
jgi:CubicO group peptidase (beta-lactamase class C family)